MIRDVLDKLSQADRAHLMYAFEHELSQFVKLPENKFVGVNITAVPNLRIKEAIGVWAYGDIKNDN